MITGGVLAIAAFVPAIFFILRGVYHFIAMLRHYRSSRHQFAANFVAFLVPFAFWVRWQVRKINREEGPVGLERQPRGEGSDERSA